MNVKDVEVILVLFTDIRGARSTNQLSRNFVILLNIINTLQQLSPMKILSILKGLTRSGASQHMLSGPQKPTDDKVNLDKNSGESDGSFSSAREMSRHEIEIEQSIYRGTKKADELKHLVKAKAQGIILCFMVTCEHKGSGIFISSQYLGKF